MQPQTPFLRNRPHNSSPTLSSEKWLFSVPKKSSGVGETRFSKIEIHMARYLLQSQQKSGHRLSLFDIEIAMARCLEQSILRFCIPYTTFATSKSHFCIPYNTFATLLECRFGDFRLWGHLGSLWGASG